MKVLITGASGFIGGHVLRRLLTKGHEVTACIHQRPVHHDIKIIRCDFTKHTSVKQWLKPLKNIDVVINCVGIITENAQSKFVDLHTNAPMTLFKACQISGVKRVINLSAMGADDQAVVNYHKSKKTVDDGLKQMSLEWFILKPSLVCGEGGKSHQWFTQLSRLPWVPLINDGQQMLQPIDVNVLVDVIEKCLVSSQPNRVIEVVGERNITYQQWLRQLNPCRTNWRFLKVPYSIAMLCARLAQFCGAKLFTPDNLTMLVQHNTADRRPLHTFMEDQS